MREATLAATLLTVVGLVLAMGAVAVAFAGWWTLLTLVASRGSVIDRLWEPGIATTAAALLFGGVATLVLRVAGAYRQHAIEHSREMVLTRKAEAAIRLALCDPNAETRFSVLGKLGQSLVLAEGIGESPRSEDVSMNLLATGKEALAIAKEAIELTGQVSSVGSAAAEGRTTGKKP